MIADSSTGILVHQIVFPLEVLGPGKRVGIWLQGCTIHCNGCISPDTWPFDEDAFISFTELRTQLNAFAKLNPDGVTISGGEPFDQAESFLRLLQILRELDFKSIMVYSGYGFEYLKDTFPDYLLLIDILISEPFILEEKNTKLWRGSDNQKIHLTSERAKKELNENQLNDSLYSDQRPLQIIQNQNSLFIAGIPKREDLGAVTLLKQRI